MISPRQHLLLANLRNLDSLTQPTCSPQEAVNHKLAPNDAPVAGLVTTTHAFSNMMIFVSSYMVR